MSYRLSQIESEFASADLGTTAGESLSAREHALRGNRGREEPEQVEEDVLESWRRTIAVRADDNAVRGATLPGRRSGDRCLKGGSADKERYVHFLGQFWRPTCLPFKPEFSDLDYADVDYRSYGPINYKAASIALFQKQQALKQQQQQHQERRPQMYGVTDENEELL